MYTFPEELRLDLILLATAENLNDRTFVKRITCTDRLFRKIAPIFCFICTGLGIGQLVYRYYTSSKLNIYAGTKVARTGGFAVYRYATM